ncbi:MAG: hypothetical protein RIS97_1716, partial [Pseudomonadota bacterium]
MLRVLTLSLTEQLTRFDLRQWQLGNQTAQHIRPCASAAGDVVCEQGFSDVFVVEFANI